MNREISKKQLLYVLLTLVFIAGIAFGSYYLFIKPVNEKMDRKQSELQMATQQLTIIENNLQQLNEQTVLSTVELQKQVPVKRLMDQLLLDIEKSEIISDVNIIEMKMNGTESDEEIDLSEEENSETETETEDPKVNSGTDPLIEEKLPNGIKKVSIVLNGQADTYFEMESFIKNLLDLKRILKVESLKYTGFDEIVSVMQEDQVVEFELAIAAYYYPELAELQKELPPLDAPRISNKRNPLSSFSELEAEEDNQAP
ncbi:pilus assembly protein PilO [Cytobacillus oceanisediminis]|uniref:pilus assembly protein PilO n=1 Tax=Cytobacillus oceanisediminis TaxID=665099 RepID=UPI001D1525C7|nr:pilus assembly protein PilO [Cytobacillus oceanisediminis]MCC3647502.1 pilus assembly protein PilO [Cytobacillus oceanisediminis]